jgi:hypothetical protein
VVDRQQKLPPQPIPHGNRKSAAQASDESGAFQRVQPRQEPRASALETGRLMQLLQVDEIQICHHPALDRPLGNPATVGEESHRLLAEAQ